MGQDLSFLKQGDLFSEKEVLGCQSARGSNKQQRQLAQFDENARECHEAVPDALLKIRGHEASGSHALNVLKTHRIPVSERVFVDHS